jgi:predicted SAM-dependent methyltransferase
MMDLARARNQHGQIWLNVASSSHVLPEYVNLDNSVYFRLEPLLPVLRHVLGGAHVTDLERYRAARARATVLLHDCRRRLPFPIGSVDHILCSHFIEHVYPDEAAMILEDFYRVLKPGGTVHIIVPSLTHLVQAYSDGKSSGDALVEATILSLPRRPSLKLRVLEFMGFEGLRHRWMYDLDGITKRVMAVGFEPAELAGLPSKSVRIQDGAESLHVAGRKRESPDRSAAQR